MVSVVVVAAVVAVVAWAAAAVVLAAAAAVVVVAMVAHAGCVAVRSSLPRYQCCQWRSPLGPAVEGEAVGRLQVNVEGPVAPPVVESYLLPSTLPPPVMKVATTTTTRTTGSCSPDWRGQRPVVTVLAPHTLLVEVRATVVARTATKAGRLMTEMPSATGATKAAKRRRRRRRRRERGMSSLQVAGQVVVEVDAPRLTSSSPRTGLLYATATCCTKQHHQVPFLFARSWHQSLLCRKRGRDLPLRLQLTLPTSPSL
jgi:hypothetical protein